MPVLCSCVLPLPVRSLHVLRRGLRAWSPTSNCDRRADDVCIARAMGGWWRQSFLCHSCSLNNCCTGMIESIPGNCRRRSCSVVVLSAALCSRGPMDLDRCPESCLLKRNSSWLPPPHPTAVAQMIGNIRYVLKRAKMHVGLAPPRIARRGICATSRFHSARRGC
eukprot:5427489-Pyramimonas_sp.AAC.1